MKSFSNFNRIRMFGDGCWCWDDNAVCACRMGVTALNNEFFTKACAEWRERLAEGIHTHTCTGHTDEISHVLNHRAGELEFPTGNRQ